MDLSPAVRTARLQALLAFIDSDALPAKMKLYAGAQPAPGAAVDDGTLLIATVVLSKPSATVLGDELTWLLPAEGQRGLDLDITWVRILTGSDEWVLDGSAGVIGDLTKDFTFDAVSGFAGAFVRVASGGIAE